MGSHAASSPSSATGWVPGGEVLGDKGEFQADSIVVAITEREVGQPRPLGGTDAVFGVGAGTVLELDGVAGYVGQRG